MLPSIAPTRPPVYRPRMFTFSSWQFWNVAVLFGLTYPINPPIQFISVLILIFSSLQSRIVTSTAEYPTKPPVNCWPLMDESDTIITSEIVSGLSWNPIIPPAQALEVFWLELISNVIFIEAREHFFTSSVPSFLPAANKPPRSRRFLPETLKFCAFTFSTFTEL